MHMWIPLIGFVLILLLFIQYQIIRVNKRRLEELYRQLQFIQLDPSTHQIHYLTGDRQLAAIVGEINQLLQRNRQSLLDYGEKEKNIRRMLANVSHDLKTPLTVILGYMEILQMDERIEPSERKRLLIRIQEKALDLSRFIHSFFDLARLESEDMNIPITTVNVSEICSNRILQFYDVLLMQKLEVQLDIPKEAVYARGNEEAIKRILDNLIQNAVHHGREGKVIGLHLRTDEQFVFIDVWDRGKGVSQPETIFQRMIRDPKDISDIRSFGSGLGLAIVKKLVEKLGGRITLASEPYVKTLFSLQLDRSKENVRNAKEI